MADDWKAPLEEVKGQVRTLSATFEAHAKDDEKRWDENRQTHRELYARTDRPSRFDSTMHALLSSLVVGLAVYLLTH